MRAAVAALLTAGCSLHALAQDADLVVVHAKVAAVDDGPARNGDGIAVRAGRVAAVGPSADIRQLAGLAGRVGMARGACERAGSVATNHHVTTLGTERIDATTARVEGHLPAWHVRKDGATVLGLETWEADARLTAAGWRTVEERLDSPLRVVMPKAE